MLIPLGIDLLVIGGFALAYFLIQRASRNESWQRAFRLLMRDKVGIAAGAVILLYLFVGALEVIRLPTGKDQWSSVLALITRGIPAEESYSAPMADRLLMRKPLPEQEILKGKHLLGTDAIGKDVLVMTLRGCGTALVIGGLTSAIYIPMGTLLGIFAGYFRKRVDDIIQYVYGVIASVPTILLLTAIIMVFGKSFVSMAGALAFTSWVSLCRLIRGETLKQSEAQYVAAARALGQSHWKIITRHILPNVMHLVVISFVLGFSELVLSEVILSYLGIGLPVGTPSWGAMIDGARGDLTREPSVWWSLAGASVALFGLVLALNLFGDSLRRAFDPRKG